MACCRLSRFRRECLAFACLRSTKLQGYRGRFVHCLDLHALTAAVKVWDIQVMLRDEHFIELHAELDRGGLRASVARAISDALHQIEAWVETTPDAELFLAVCTPRGHWVQIATRRWRVAAYFLLTHYEQAFVAGAAESDAGESVQARSGVVSRAAADTEPIPRRSRGRAD
jgi:hypothetical protein